MAKDPFDMGNGDASASPNALAKVRDGIKEMVQIIEFIEKAEGDLAAAKNALQAIRTRKLPDLMAEIQSDHFTHNGWEIKVSEFVSGSIPKEGEPRKIALDWLVNNDGDGIIKTTIQLEFGKTQHKEADKLAKDLVKQGHAPKMNLGVNSQTLCRWARERLRNGEALEPEILGLSMGKVVKPKKLEES
jgi:hypothetical protein